MDRAAEAAHLLMSLAMIATTWGWTGGPGSTSGMVQVGLFGLFALWFVAGAVGGSIPDGLHTTNAAAMVWMVVAMPELMGMGTHTTWTTAVTVLFTALLVATAWVWIYRAVAAGTDDAAPIADAAGTVAVQTAARRHRGRTGRRLLSRADEPRHGRDVRRHALKPYHAHPVGRIRTRAGTGRILPATSAHA